MSDDKKTEKEHTKKQTAHKSVFEDMSENKTSLDAESKKDEKLNSSSSEIKKAEDSEKKKTPEKKSNSWKGYVVALIIVAVIAVVAIILFSKNNVPVTPSADSTAFTYNNYHFQKTSEGYWSVGMSTAFGDQQVLFYYNPLQLENYSYQPVINNYLKAVQNNRGTVYISFRPEIMTKGNGGPAAIAGVEVAKISSKVLGLKTKSAITASIGDENFTTFNCDNATSENFVVEIGLANTTELRMDKKYCVTILGSNVNDTIKLADLFAYKSTGIMKTK